MSDKLIRDELLRSHRYQTLSGDTPKLMFLHLFLSSDHYSNAEATTTALSIIMCRTVTEEAAATILSELQDKDLCRIYLDSDGKRYVHIPRSRQRIRYKKRAHPAPPVHIEDHAIKALEEKVGRNPPNPRQKRSVVAVTAKGTTPEPEPNSGDSLGINPQGPWWKTMESLKAKGLSVGILGAPGETRDSLYKRISAKLKSAKESQP